MFGFKKIISVFLTFATVLYLCVPSYAEDYSSDTTNFEDWILRGTNDSGYLGALLQYAIGKGDNGICSVSSDGHHHADSIDRSHGFGSDSGGNYGYAVCKHCGQSFKVYTSDLQAAYNSYVSELPVNGIDSENGYIWWPTVSDLYNSSRYYGTDASIYPLVNDWRYNISFCDDGHGIIYQSTKQISSISHYIVASLMWSYSAWSDLRIEFNAPVDGQYFVLPYDKLFYGRYITKTGDSGTFSICSSLSQSFVNVSNGVVGWVPSVDAFQSSSDIASYSGVLRFPKFRVLLLSAPSGDTYSVDYRPVSVSAPVTYTDNSGHTQTTETNIVNETNKTVYNPVTGDTTTYDNWDYDYSTRTYTFSGGDKTTTTVTYGDEYMTVKEGDTTYIYNYYVAPSSDTPDNPETPSGSHTHNYTSAVTREATCTTAGIETFTCSECGNSYTKSIAALGHDWTIKEQIPTAYDDNGEIVTQGYTVYKCSRCGEEYKSTDGKPPESGGNSGSSLWDKIGQLLGTVGGGLLGLIGQFFAAIFDALISLAEMVNEKLSTILEMVLGWFEQFPALFSGFMAFLTAIFGFLPEEMLLLLEFGLAAVLFIGILKAIRRR